MIEIDPNNRPFGVQNDPKNSGMVVVQESRDIRGTSDKLVKEKRSKNRETSQFNEEIPDRNHSFAVAALPPKSHVAKDWQVVDATNQ